jgi:hypothetical protein
MIAIDLYYRKKETIMVTYSTFTYTRTDESNEVY